VCIIWPVPDVPVAVAGDGAFEDSCILEQEAIKRIVTDTRMRTRKDLIFFIKEGFKFTWLNGINVSA